MLIESFLDLVVPSLAASLEGLGIVIILIAVIKTLKGLFQNRFDFSQDDLKLTFAQGLAYGLEFKLAAEIIKTAVVHDLQEFIVLACVVFLRVILTVVIHFELKRGD